MLQNPNHIKKNTKSEGKNQNPQKKLKAETGKEKTKRKT